MSLSWNTGPRYYLVLLTEAPCLKTGNVRTLVFLLQHRRSETLGTCTTPSQVTQGKARCTSKLPQASGQFCVELARGSTGFGFTLSGGRDAAGDTPLAVRGLLKDGPAERCGRLQVSHEARSIRWCWSGPCPLSGCSPSVLPTAPLLSTLAGWRPRAPHQRRNNSGPHPCPGRGADSRRRTPAPAGAKQAS